MAFIIVALIISRDVSLLYVRLIFLSRAAIQPAEDISARLVVDGTPYRESVGSFAVLSRHWSSGMLEREIVLNLQVILATVQVWLGEVGSQGNPLSFFDRIITGCRYYQD